MRARQTRLLQRIAAMCLHWPDEQLHTALPLIAEAARELPAPQRDAVAGVVAHLEQAGPVAAGQRYVELFDVRPGRCLYLTWYTDGDTRRRGGSLARLKQVYRDNGFHLNDGELPDYLPVLLEFAALGGDPGQRLLAEFRPALVRLHQALSKIDTAYASLVEAVLTTVPAPRKGTSPLPPAPPVEQVGMEPVLLGYPTTRPEGVR